MVIFLQKTACLWRHVQFIKQTSNESTHSAYIVRCTYCVFGGLPGFHFADILHVLKLPQLGQSVVTQGLVQWRVTVLVLHVQLSLGSNQQLDENAEDRIEPICSVLAHLLMLTFTDAVVQACNDIWSTGDAFQLSCLRLNCRQWINNRLCARKRIYVSTNALKLISPSCGLWHTMRDTFKINLRLMLF